MWLCLQSEDLKRFFFVGQTFQGKFKRLKKAQRHAQGDVGGLSDEEEFLGAGKGGRTAEEKLKFSLFGDVEGMSFWILCKTLLVQCSIYRNRVFFLLGHTMKTGLIHCSIYRTPT